MATTAVTILVKTLGDSKLKTLDDRLKSVEKSAERVGGSTTRAANGIAATGRSALGASAGVKSFGASLKAALGPIAAVAATIGGVTAGFREISAFNFSGAKVKTLGVDLEALKTELKAVGQELGGSRSQAELLAASYDVASAGFRDAADAAEVLKASSLAASGGFSTLAITSDAATSVLNAYGLSAKSAGKIVDQFVQTQNDGKIVVDQYAQSIGVVASAAAGLGIPLSEINAAVAQSTIAGNDAAKVFTGLKVALQRLASGEAAKAIEDTGIKITAASLESDGLFKTLKKLEKLDVGQVFKALGTEAAPALLPVLNNLEEYERLIKNQEEAVNTSKDAQLIAAQTLEGAYARLGVAFSDAFTAQEGAVVALLPLIDGVTAAVKSLSTPLGETVTKVALATAGAVLLGKAFVTLRTAIIALKATALAGWLVQQAALVKAFGIQIYATAAAKGVLTTATIALKAAMATIGWGVFIAGAIATANATYQAFAAWVNFNRILNEAPLTEVEKKIEELNKDLITAESKTVTWYEALLDFIIGAEGASTAVDGISASIDRLNQRRIQMLDTRPEQGADLDMDAIRRMSDLYEGPTVPTPTIDTPKGKGAAPKTDDLESLKGRIALLQQIAPIQDKINIAILNGDELTAARLEGEKAVLEQMASGEDALRRMNTEAGKQYQTTINRLELDEQLRANALAVEQTNERLLEQEEQRKEALEGTLRPIQDQITLLKAKLNGNEEEIKQLIEIRDLEEQIRDNGGDPSQAAAYVKQRDELAKQAEAADKLEAQYKSLAESIASSLTGAFRSVVTGAKSAEQALSDAFKGIADAFLDMAMKMIQEWMVMQALGLVKSLFSSGPGATPLVDALAGQGSAFTPGGSMPFFGSQQPSMLATGGTANGGQPYIVGESGPELFIPGVTGMVSNNDQFEAARDAMSGGSSPGADGSVSSDSAGVSSAFAENTSSITTTNSYMRERSMERSSQTTVGGGGSLVVETQVINNVEYATVEQMQLASAASAKQARAEVFRDLRNKPAARASVGMR